MHLQTKKRKRKRYMLPVSGGGGWTCVCSLNTQRSHLDNFSVYRLVATDFFRAVIYSANYTRVRNYRKREVYYVC